MRRRAALILGAVMLAATPAVARIQTVDPAAQPGIPPPDMPVADGARMAELELQAVAAMEAGDWASVERLLREGLALEQKHYAPDDVRIGHSWAWLARAAQEQGRPPSEVVPLLENRLRIAEAHPGEGDTLAGARYGLATQLMLAGRAAEAVEPLRGAEAWLAGRGPEQADSLRTVRTELGRALSASGEKAQAAIVLKAALDAVPAEGHADERAHIAWELAVVLIDLDRHAEAEAPLRTAAERYRAEGERRGEVLATYWLADSLRRADRAAQADELLSRVVALETSAPVEERALTVEQLRTTIQPLGDRRREAGRQDEAVAAYRLVVEANRTRPGEKTHLASALGRLGLSLYGAANYAEAVSAQQEALEIWKAERTAPHNDVATQMEQLGRSQLRADKHLEALRSLGEAATMREALGQEQTTTVLTDHAEAAELTGRLDRSLALRQRVVERLTAETPQRPEVLASAWGDMAHTAYLLQKPAESEAFYRRGLELATGAPLREILTTGLAFALTEQGRGEEGEPMQRQVLADVAARLGPAHKETALAMNALANLLSRRGDHARAEPLVRDALAILEAESDPDRERVAALKMNLGVIVSELGRNEEALRLLAEAFATRRDLFGAGHPSTVNVIGMIAHEYIDIGAHDRAEPLFAQMVGLREIQFGPDHLMVADALQNHAYALRAMGRHGESEALMRRAAGIVETASQDPRKRIRFNANWGVSLVDAGRPAEAVAVFRRAQAQMLERRRTAADPGWSRSESDGFRFLFRHSVQAAWAASRQTAP